MEFAKLLEKRRAYRSLKPVEITNSIINELYQALKLTPSCYNNQPWRYAIIRNQTNKEKLSSLTKERKSLDSLMFEKFI